MDWTHAFATTETTRLFLDEGKKFWIDVRNELTQAEQRSIQFSSFRGISRTTLQPNDPNSLVELDLSAGGSQKVFIYLADWNLQGPDGKTIDISSEAKKRDGLKNLTPAHYEAIEQAIDEHAARMAESKKAPSGIATSDLISP